MRCACGTVFQRKLFSRITTALLAQNGRTPLLIGASNGNLAQVYMCLQYGANVDAIDNVGPGENAGQPGRFSLMTSVGLLCAEGQHRAHACRAEWIHKHHFAASALECRRGEGESGVRFVGGVYRRLFSVL